MQLSELKKKCKVYDEQIIFHLSLSGEKLLNINILAKCQNLVTLDVSFNNIDDLSALSSLPKLKRLNASNNRIRKLHTLSNLMELECINLESNEISSFMQVSHLSSSRNFPSLLHVSFKANPICNDQSYSQKILELFVNRSQQMMSIDNRYILCDGTQKSIDNLLEELNKRQIQKECVRNQIENENSEWIGDSALASANDTKPMDANNDLKFQSIKQKLYASIQSAAYELSKMDIAFKKLKKSI